MSHRIAIVLLALFALHLQAWSQSEDPILFTVEDDPVHVSEFEYIYTKTNGDNADFSKASLQEYLDLYIKFKLKVQRAKDMKLDTIPSLQQELEGYRRQLSDSYLIDREVTDKLIQEAYERIQQDVEISHILITASPNAAPSDTLTAYRKISAIKKRLEEGADFADLAESASEDRSTKERGGKVGYITALLPNGFYPLEMAAYTVPEGEISDIIRTNAGYHIVKVHNRRPARGEMEVAHILIRKVEDGSNAVAAKAKIDSLHQALEAGANFEQLARQYSDDKRTAERGGYLGIFGINRYERSFEDAAFALENDNAYSEPFETSIGWHIVKRISKKDIQPFAIEKSRLEAKIKQDTRFEKAKEAMIEQIKEDANFQNMNTVLKTFIDTVGQDFNTFRWRVPQQKPQDVLFSLGKTRVTLGDFMEYAQQASRNRIRLGRSNSTESVVRALYEDFVDSEALKYEEQQLEEKYPEFKALMREYEEGILLFEATKMLVWDKASQDTTGLRAFFKTLDNKYKWDERVVVSQYSLRESAKDQIDEVRAYASEHSPEETLAKFNSESENILSVEEKTFEKGRNEVIDSMKWKVGELSHNEEASNRSLNFLKIEKVLPAEPKTLEEARGYVVADYQDYLERQWVEELREEYEVEVNEEVFQDLIEK